MDFEGNVGFPDIEQAIMPWVRDFSYRGKGSRRRHAGILTGHERADIGQLRYR
jgi:hypothetical protein